MTKTTNSQPSQRARLWLRQFSDALDSAPEMIDVMPIADVRSELQGYGANVDGVRRQLAKAVQTAKLHRLLDRITQWISPVWEPLWAGQPVTADEIPKQEYTFTSEYGKIALTCEWNAARQMAPAFLRLAWEASLEHQSRLVARFINPQSQEIRAEICLGTSLSGEETLTSDELGFDPSSERWALSLILRDVAP